MHLPELLSRNHASIAAAVCGALIADCGVNVATNRFNKKSTQLPEFYHRQYL